MGNLLNTLETFSFALAFSIVVATACCCCCCCNCLLFLIFTLSLLTMLQVIRRLPPKSPLCHVNHIIKSNFLWFPEPKEAATRLCCERGYGGGSGCGGERDQFQKIDRLISIFRIVNGTTSRIRNAHESRNNPLKWFAIHSPWMLNAFMPHAITLLATNDEYVYRYI